MDKWYEPSPESIFSGKCGEPNPKQIFGKWMESNPLRGEWKEGRINLSGNIEPSPKSIFEQ